MRADAAGAPRLARRAAAARTVKACKSYAHTCKSRSAIVVCATQEGKARKRSPIQCAADLRGCEHQEEEGEQARQHDILMIERSMESTRARERDLVPRKARGHARCRMRSCVTEIQARVVRDSQVKSRHLALFVFCVCCFGGWLHPPISQNQVLISRACVR